MEKGGKLPLFQSDTWWQSHSFDPGHGLTRLIRTCGYRWWEEGQKGEEQRAEAQKARKGMSERGKVN